MAKYVLKKWENKLPKRAMDRNCMDNLVWLVPATVCTLPFLKHARYVPGDDERQ